MHLARNPTPARHCANQRAGELGPSPLGQRFLIDIAGGSFEGPQLKGIVLPGSADRQLLRSDGVKELDALYEMQTDDGAVITVHKRVLV